MRQIVRYLLIDISFIFIFILCFACSLYFLCFIIIIIIVVVVVRKGIFAHLMIGIVDYPVQLTLCWIVELFIYLLN